MDGPIAQWGLCLFEIYVRNFTRYGPQLEFLTELKKYVNLYTVKIVRVNENSNSSMLMKLLAPSRIVATY